MNENITLCESYKSYQDFHQSNSSQLKQDAAEIKSQVEECDLFLQVLNSILIF